MNKVVILLSIALSITGCASNVSQKTTQPVSASNEVVNAIYINISHTSSVAENSDYASVKEELIAATTKKIKSTLPNVAISTGQKPASGISANIEIQELNYVSGAARFWGGALSGQAKLGAKVVLVDIPSNKQLGETALGTSSKFSEGIFGGTTSRQVEATANQIVALLQVAAKQ